jgi:TPR repeat protein
MKRLVLALLLVVVQAGPTWAGWEEGLAASARGDFETAVREFQPLAEQGHVAAQYYLGSLYRAGLGVPQDYYGVVKPAAFGPRRRQQAERLESGRSDWRNSAECQLRHQRVRGQDLPGRP